MRRADDVGDVSSQLMVDKTYRSKRHLAYKQNHLCVFSTNRGFFTTRGKKDTWIHEVSFPPFDSE